MEFSTKVESEWRLVGPDGWATAWYPDSHPFVDFLTACAAEAEGWELEERVGHDDHSHRTA